MGMRKVGEKTETLEVDGERTKRSKAKWLT